MIKRKVCLFICLLTMSLGALANTTQSTLQPFKAEYIAYKWGDPLGTAFMQVEQLSNTKFSLLYQSKVSKFFLSDKRTEHSIFRFADNQFTPEEYHYSRTGTGSDKSLHVAFTESDSKIKVMKDDEEFDLTWDNETDNQLYRLALPLQLAEGKTHLDINFINYRGEKKQYLMRVEGTETLALPYGNIEAIKIVIVRQNSSRSTYAWFAPSLNHLLVRLQQFKDGEEQGDIKLATFTPN